jgi:ABC-2 type transport system permease protein
VVQGTVSSVAQGIRILDTNNTKAVIVIPQGFERDVGLQRMPQVQVLLDGVDGNGSAITAGYIQRILQSQVPKVMLETRMLYNPQLESKYNIVPGIIAILLTMITVFLTAINLVREKELGTLEQLSVTPIRKHELILGKVLPLAIVGLLLFTVSIMAAALIFHIYCAGNLLLLYGLAIIYMFTTLGLGIFFSTVSQTQQQAMFFAWFFSIFSIMLSGFFVPIENMPTTIQYITYLNPTRYFIEIVRGVYLKASDFSVLWPQCGAMIIFGVTVLSLSIARFQKRMS